MILSNKKGFCGNSWFFYVQGSNPKYTLCWWNACSTSMMYKCSNSGEYNLATTGRCKRPSLQVTDHHHLRYDHGEARREAGKGWNGDEKEADEDRLGPLRGWVNWRQILIPFLGLNHFHGSTRTCVSDITGARASRPAFPLSTSNHRPIQIRKN